MPTSTSLLMSGRRTESQCTEVDDNIYIVIPEETQSRPAACRSRAELAEVMIEVAVAEDAPGAAVQAAESGMFGPDSLHVALAHRFHELSEIGRFCFPVRGLARDQLGRRRRPLGKREPVDEELFQRGIAQRKSLGLGRKLAQAHSNAVGAMSHHLRGAHAAPERSAVSTKTPDPLL